MSKTQIIEVKLPASIAVPPGTVAVYAEPKQGQPYLTDMCVIAAAINDWSGLYRICFVPKYQWPTDLPGIAISRNNDGYILHFEKPVQDHGRWMSSRNKIIHRECYPEGWIPVLEIGECFFKPEVS